MSDVQKDIDQLCVNTIRMLSVDQVEKAASGHPGMPMGTAPIAYVIWTRCMKHNPTNPQWPNRDRFILSAGHGSALLYSMLHLTGYDLPLDELKNFRQWGSKTPGHPEHALTPGVECTTGPLGQGFSMGVGMAVAARWRAHTFNVEGYPLVDHYIYAICSDGDLMEGVASEAASLAGNLQLGNLIYFYDDNHITIEGRTEMTFTEDVQKRFEAYGWQTLRVEDGNDLDAIGRAIETAQAEQDRPTLILTRTHIGYGSPVQDTAKVHGEPLKDDYEETRKFFGWPDEMFHIPDEALERMRECVDRGKQAEAEWQEMFKKYRNEYPEFAEQFERELAGELPEDWDAEIPVFGAESKPDATRSVSGKVLNAIAGKVPNLIGGSADLAGSTKTLIDDGGDMGPGKAVGRNLHYGVREHGMGAVVNGMALYGGVIPYGATFLIFSDYMRPTLRLAALQELHAIFIFTHDSIGLGEDGPTHQPIEHLASLRAIPFFTVIRPADANETAEAWRSAMQMDTPVALVLTRQKLPVLDPEKYPVKEGAGRGAYVLSDCEAEPQVILIATGSEVHLALDCQKELASQHINARVVSMPSWEIFAAQPQNYRDQVLPPHIKHRVSIEAGATLGWCGWVGADGATVGIDRFGSSAPYIDNYKGYDLTVEHIVPLVQDMLQK